MEEVTASAAEDISAQYRCWADAGVGHASATYHAWAHGVAADAKVLGLLAELPGPKRQPNLVFGAARYLGCMPDSFVEFRSWLLDHWEQTRGIVLTRSTQTNEAARCAVLLPALAELDGPLALIEVGASAGLCLYPDRYSYRYETSVGEVSLDPRGGRSPVVIDCRFDDAPDGSAARPPTRVPRLAWRAGVDLNPLSVTDPDTERWLTALVWPEHEERRRRLHAALSVASDDPPHLVRGDLNEAADELIAEIPAGSHPVVFHSAVLAYLDAEARARFARHMLERDDVTWIANEGFNVVPGISTKVTPPSPGHFMVSIDGLPHGFAEQHGRYYSPLGSAVAAGHGR